MLNKITSVLKFRRDFRMLGEGEREETRPVLSSIETRWSLEPLLGDGKVERVKVLSCDESGESVRITNVTRGLRGEEEVRE